MSLAVVLLATGCGHLKSKPPGAVQNGGAMTHYAATAFETDRKAYVTAMDGRQYDVATVLRDRMLFRIRVDIDASYASTEEQLHQQRAGFATFADFAELRAALGCVHRGRHRRGRAHPAGTGSRRSAGGARALPETITPSPPDALTPVS